MGELMPDEGYPELLSLSNLPPTPQIKTYQLHPEKIKRPEPFEIGGLTLIYTLRKFNEIIDSFDAAAAAPVSPARHFPRVIPRPPIRRRQGDAPNRREIPQKGTGRRPTK